MKKSDSNEYMVSDFEFNDASGIDQALLKFIFIVVQLQNFGFKQADPILSQYSIYVTPKTSEQQNLLIISGGIEIKYWLKMG